jgi:NADH dehydrogenase
MSGIVTIFGGSGFVGRYVARRMARAGWRVRVAVRRPNEAIFVRPYGTPGQVEPVLCNIRDESSVAAALAGANAAVNCVGTFDRGGRNAFGPVHVDGAGRIARAAAAAGVARLVHISAIGASESAPSLYGRSKAAGEAAVTAAFPGAVILRPSVIFGPEDQFFNRFAGMARLGPVLPIAGGATRFQPVHVDDVAQAAVAGVTGAAAPGVYELGGPEVDSFTGLMRRMLAVINRRRLVVSLPAALMAVPAFLLDMVQAASGGLLRNSLITRDQLASLSVDNVVTPGARGLADLGITPTPMEAVLPEYLWRYRPSGQYEAIKASAQNLKKS